MSLKQDGVVVIGARCTDEDCDWKPLGTDDTRHWDIIERLRLEHEEETGHTVTVETVEQKTILAERMSMMDTTLELADRAGVGIEWVCPECERTAEELDAGRRCPDCQVPFREAWP